MGTNGDKKDANGDQLTPMVMHPDGDASYPWCFHL
jgi:hypothetical protein